MADKKSIILILIVIGAILSVCGVVIAATVNIPDPNVYTGTIYVSTTGNDDSKGFTPETSKKSIKKAVDNAPYDATVLVAPGTYIEDTIHIDKKIKLTSETPETTIIRSKSTAIKIEAYDVVVKGFTIRPEVYRPWYAGIWSISGSGLVEKCIIKGFNEIDGKSIDNRDAVLVVKDCSIVDHKSLPEYERSLH